VEIGEESNKNKSEAVTESCPPTRTLREMPRGKDANKQECIFETRGILGR